MGNIVIPVFVPKLAQYLELTAALGSIEVTGQKVASAVNPLGQPQPGTASADDSLPKCAASCHGYSSGAELFGTYGLNKKDGLLLGFIIFLGLATMGLFSFLRAQEGEGKIGRLSRKHAALRQFRASNKVIKTQSPDAVAHLYRNCVSLCTHRCA